MTIDNYNVLEDTEQKFKDMESYLKSSGNPVASADISNMGGYVIDGIDSGIERSVLGVSLKKASESLKSLSITLSSLTGKLNKGGK